MNSNLGFSPKPPERAGIGQRFVSLLGFHEDGGTRPFGGPVDEDLEVTKLRNQMYQMLDE